MPKFSQPTFTAENGHFAFSAVRPEALAASAYTLVTLMVDTTSSVAPFRRQLWQTVKRVVESCQQSPRRDHLLLRVVTFNTERRELHGFRVLTTVDPNAYPPLRPSGATALYDAAFDAVQATARYGELLCDQGFIVNAVVFIITDGCDNRSRLKPHHLAAELDRVSQAERIESFITLLVGINAESTAIARALAAFQRQANLTQYIDAGRADAERLATLAEFVERGIALQSQLLGSGQKPPPLYL